MELGQIASSRLVLDGPIESVTNLDEQALIAHPSQVTTGNADIREIARSHHPSCTGERHFTLGLPARRSASARSRSRLRILGSSGVVGSREIENA